MRLSYRCDNSPVCKLIFSHKTFFGKNLSQNHNQDKLVMTDKCMDKLMDLNILPGMHGVTKLILAQTSTRG